MLYHITTFKGSIPIELNSNMCHQLIKMLMFLKRLSNAQVFEVLKWWVSALGWLSRIFHNMGDYFLEIHDYSFCKILNIDMLGL